MRKIKNILFMMSIFMLVNVFAIRVNASAVSLADVASQFNEDAKEYEETSIDLEASICTSELVSEDECEKAGNLIITTTYELEESEASSTCEYNLEGNIISSYVTAEDAIGLQMLLESIGKVNKFNYNHQDLMAFISADEVFNYSIEKEGFSVKDVSKLIGGAEEIFEVKIDITKKLPLFSSKRLDITTNGDGKVAINDDIKANKYEISDFHSVVKESSKYTISAKAGEANKFTGWTLNGEEYSNESTITITVDKDILLVANFDLDIQEIKGADITLIAPKVGDTITKVAKKDEYGEWEEQSSFPKVSTKTEGLNVNAYWSQGLDELAEEPFYGTFEKDKYYYVLIDFESKYGYELSPTFPDNLTVNGVKPEEVFEVQMGTWNHCIVKIKAKEVITDYKILDGDNQTFEKGKDLIIRANGYVEDLVMLKADGNELDKAHYTIKNGSTIATLSAEYLSTLKSGKHTLTFVYNNGEVNATFTIPTNNPSTGDNMILYSLILTLSIFGIASAVIYLRKESM